MTISHYRYLSLALGILSTLLLVCLLWSRGELNQYRCDVRYAHDIIWGFQTDRDLALKAEVPKAVDFLERLHFPEGQPSPFSGSLSNYVERQRGQAVRDIIAYLRTKTGKDLGTNPEVWIQEYGRK